MNNKYFIIGGARSGKSYWGQLLSENLPGQKIFLATAQAWDDEMRERIRRHQEVRGASWQTVEEPLQISEKLTELDHPGNVILLDCLTLWLSNLMTVAELPEKEIEEQCRSLARLLPNLQSTIILVSNEVGWGIVPDNYLSRLFRDLAGQLNRWTAASCSTVIMVTAGLPLALKGILPELMQSALKES